MTTELSAHPPHIRLGFVGARSLADAQRHWLALRLHEAFSEAASARPYPLRLASGMAHGADRIAVDTFLRWGESQEPRHTEVLAIYPCAIAAFRDYSAVDDPTAFDEPRERLLAAGGAELVLDGTMPRSVNLKPEQLKAAPPEVQQRAAEEKRVRASANTYQSEVLIRQCEFLISVLDRSEAGEPGGTRETVAKALAMDTPVLVLDPRDQAVFVARYGQDLRPSYHPPQDWQAPWQAALREGLPLPPSADTADAGLEQVYQPLARKPMRQRWERFLAPFKADAESRHKALAHTAASAARTGAEASVPAISTAAADTAHARPVLLFRSSVRVLAAVVGAAFTPKTLNKPRPEEQPSIAHWRNQVADAQAQEMSEYRGIFLSNYLLGLLAVVLAVSALSLLALTALKPGLGSLLALLALTLAKFWVVRRISHNTHRAEHHQHGDIAIGLRYIAERLRLPQVLLQAGSARMDLLYQSPRRGRAHEICEDLCRRMPLADCARAHDSKLALKAALDLIARQLDYHGKTSRTMQALYQHLEAAVARCGRLVVWVVGFDLTVLAAKLALKFHLLDGLLSPAALGALGNGLGLLGLVCVAATALLPAAMASFNAILFQSQAEQLAERHGAMAQALAGLKSEGERLQADIAAGRFDTSPSHAVLAFAERTSALMAEEVAEWATMYRQGIREA